MKFLLFIDDIYSTIISSIITFSTIMLVFSYSFYEALPLFIPNHAFLWFVDGWGSKKYIFIFPLCLIALAFMLSKKNISRFFPCGYPKLFMECLNLGLLVLVFLETLFVYFVCLSLL